MHCWECAVGNGLLGRCCWECAVGNAGAHSHGSLHCVVVWPVPFHSPCYLPSMFQLGTHLWHVLHAIIMIECATILTLSFLISYSVCCRTKLNHDIPFHQEAHQCRWTKSRVHRLCSSNLNETRMKQHF